MVHVTLSHPCHALPSPLPAFSRNSQTQVKLRAEANILSRANDKLKAEKAADAARVAALQQELSGLQQQLTSAGSVADKLRAELAERDGVISDNYVTMQGLRRRVQELETHKFVLTYKASPGLVSNSFGSCYLRGPICDILSTASFKIVFS